MRSAIIPPDPRRGHVEYNFLYALYGERGVYTLLQIG
jgi:hypothetical protein